MIRLFSVSKLYSRGNEAVFSCNFMKFRKTRTSKINFKAVSMCREVWMGSNLHQLKYWYWYWYLNVYRGIFIAKMQNLGNFCIIWNFLPLRGHKVKKSKIYSEFDMRSSLLCFNKNKRCQHCIQLRQVLEITNNKQYIGSFKTSREDLCSSIKCKCSYSFVRACVHVRAYSHGWWSPKLYRLSRP